MIFPLISVDFFKTKMFLNKNKKHNNKYKS